MRIILQISLVLAAALPAFGDEASPIRVSHPQDVSTNFVAFENKLHPGNRIGYRIHEHLPLVAGETPKTEAEAGIDRDEVNRLTDRFSKAPGVYRIVRPVTEEGWIPQRWEFFFAPVPSGIEILWIVETGETGLPEFYAAQQCFRMSGLTNMEWRRKIAETAAFSEYDLWSKLEGEGKPLESLSFHRSGGEWKNYPPTREKVISRTPFGARLEALGDLSEEVVHRTLDPKHPGAFIEDSDSGLTARTDRNGDWISGIYWEGTTHLSNHHPADCLHAIVNLGPIPPHGKRAVRGKIYWMKGDLEELASVWMRDFPE